MLYLVEPVIDVELAFCNCACNGEGSTKCTCNGVTYEDIVNKKENNNGGM